MRNKIQHTHIFSGLFTKSPQLSNILGGIYIRIGIATVWTTKRRTFSITNHFANIADLTRIMGINHNEGNTYKLGFIFKKGTKLSKSPRVMSSSLCFSNFYSSPNIGQVFNGNSFISKPGLLHDTFTDGMIGERGMSFFSAFKPFQAFSTAGRVFALERFPRLKIFISTLSSCSEPY